MPAIRSFREYPLPPKVVLSDVHYDYAYMHLERDHFDPTIRHNTGNCVLPPTDTLGGPSLANITRQLCGLVADLSYDLAGRGTPIAVETSPPLRGATAFKLSGIRKEDHNPCVSFQDDPKHDEAPQKFYESFLYDRCAWKAENEVLLEMFAVMQEERIALNEEILIARQNVGDLREALDVLWTFVWDLQAARYKLFCDAEEDQMSFTEHIRSLDCAFQASSKLIRCEEDFIDTLVTQLQCYCEDLSRVAPENHTQLSPQPDSDARNQPSIPVVFDNWLHQQPQDEDLELSLTPCERRIGAKTDPELHIGSSCSNIEKSLDHMCLAQCSHNDAMQAHPASGDLVETQTHPNLQLVEHELNGGLDGQVVLKAIHGMSDPNECPQQTLPGGQEEVPIEEGAQDQHVGLSTQFTNVPNGHDDDDPKLIEPTLSKSPTPLLFVDLSDPINCTSATNGVSLVMTETGTIKEHYQEASIHRKVFEEDFTRQPPSEFDLYPNHDEEMFETQVRPDGLAQSTDVQSELKPLKSATQTIENDNATLDNPASKVNAKTNVLDNGFYHLDLVKLELEQARNNGASSGSAEGTAPPLHPIQPDESHDSTESEHSLINIVGMWVAETGHSATNVHGRQLVSRWHEGDTKLARNDESLEKPEIKLRVELGNQLESTKHSDVSAVKGQFEDSKSCNVDLCPAPVECQINGGGKESHKPLERGHSTPRTPLLSVGMNNRVTVPQSVIADSARQEVNMAALTDPIGAEQNVSALIIDSRNDEYHQVTRAQAKPQLFEVSTQTADNVTEVPELAIIQETGTVANVEQNGMYNESYHVALDELDCERKRCAKLAIELAVSENRRRELEFQLGILNKDFDYLIPKGAVGEVPSEGCPETLQGPDSENKQALSAMTIEKQSAVNELRTLQEVSQQERMHTADLLRMLALNEAQRKQLESELLSARNHIYVASEIDARTDLAILAAKRVVARSRASSVSRSENSHQGRTNGSTELDARVSDALREAKVVLGRQRGSSVSRGESDMRGHVHVPAPIGISQQKDGVSPEVQEVLIRSRARISSVSRGSHTVHRDEKFTQQDEVLSQ
ncbi:hypothetical protein HDU93_001139 [Gonapodya sp. JEL0774]|nr:hypothetical protein HDU93_001139 [Gonapodya sp. JEL0774]